MPGGQQTNLDQGTPEVRVDVKLRSNKSAVESVVLSGLDIAIGQGVLTPSQSGGDVSWELTGQALGISQGAFSVQSEAASATQGLVGQTITVSQGPLWMPGAGEIAAVSLNTISSVNPCPADNCVYSSFQKLKGLFTWCGLTQVPTLGTFGSLLMQGGGHDAYQGNEFYRYDFESRLWSRPKDPYAAWVIGPSGFYTDAITGEFYSNADGTIAGDDTAREPWPAHTYDSSVLVPGADVGNTHGCVFQGFTQWKQLNANKQNHWIYCDTMRWRRVGDVPATGGFTYGPACYDSTRKQLIKISSTSPGNTHFRMPLATQVWAAFGTGHADAGEGNLDYSPTHDILIRSVHAGGSTFSLKIYEAGSPGIPTQPTLLGTGPTRGPGVYAGGSEYVDDKNSLYYYPGSGKTMWKLTPTGNPRTDPWQWTEETLIYSGTVASQVAVGADGPHYSRFRYVPALDAFSWLASYDTPVYIFKPATLL